MYTRTIQAELDVLAKHYPVVSVMGPRQSGKTTLVQNAFKKKPYVNLEFPDERLFAEQDPRGFLDRYPEGAILDEVQRTPHLLSYIQGIVDKQKTNGLYILTGSHQFELHAAISQSLAGRVGLLNLLPLTQQELFNSNIHLELDTQLYRGFYPRIYSENLDPTKAYRNYLQTYLEKDLRALSDIKNLLQFQTFMKLCAGRIGQLMDYASLGNDLGVSTHTVKHWLSILEASYIIVRLKPYFENVGKRLIKSPKLYFVDVGLACYLLDIENEKQVSRDPLRGSLVENLVVLDLMKHRYNAGLDPNLYFYRDNHKNEVDLIIKKGHELIPVEIKAAKTFTTDFLKGLYFLKKLLPARINKAYLIYAGEQQQKIDDIQLLNYKNVGDIYS